MEKRAYDDPPLIEAVCEFRFPPDADWDNTIPGRLYERLDDFPDKRSGKHVDVNVGIEGDVFRPSFNAQERTLFLNEDETYVVQLLPNVLTVHRLEPYSSWDEMRPTVLEVLRGYVEVAEPEKVHRANVRYLNHIELADAVKLEDHFDFYPHLGEQLPRDHGAFMTGVEFPQNEDELLRLEMTSVSPREDESNVALRLDLTYARLRSVAFQQWHAEDWLNRAHDEIEETFEGAIRDPLREKFGVQEAA